MHREHHLGQHLLVHVGDADPPPESCRYSTFRWNAASPSAFAASTTSSRSGVAAGSSDVLGRRPGTAACSASRSPSRSQSSGRSASARNFRHRVLQRRLDHLPGFGLELLAPLQREQPERVDHLALLVHHVVVLQQPLAGLEVLQLDPLLRLLDGARDQRA